MELEFEREKRHDVLMVVDPGERTLERLMLDGEQYVIAAAAAEGDVFRPESFEGLEIALTELWTIPDEQRH